MASICGKEYNLGFYKGYIFYKFISLAIHLVAWFDLARETFEEEKPHPFWIIIIIHNGEPIFQKYTFKNYVAGSYFGTPRYWKRKNCTAIYLRFLTTENNNFNTYRPKNNNFDSTINKLFQNYVKKITLDIDVMSQIKFCCIVHKFKIIWTHKTFKN